MNVPKEPIMTVYALAQFTIHDRERYDQYAARFLQVLRRFEGSLLAADESPLIVEGTWAHDKVVLLSFPSTESFRAWAGSDDYTRISTDRVASTSGTVLLVHGIGEAITGSRSEGTGL
jgi:uncharacterized protein (DUF1330 family)